MGGSTGGIMDYGSGKWNNAYQFNTKYRTCELCSVLSSLRESPHSGFLRAHGTTPGGAAPVLLAKGCPCEDPAGSTGWRCSPNPCDTCQNVKQHGYCAHPTIAKACPVACGLCTSSPMASSTGSPTGSPTASPTASPTTPSCTVPEVVIGKPNTTYCS